VVRTAQMADVCTIVFVRGKMPQPETIELAAQENIPLITSPFGTFELCGRLYKAGLHSFESFIPSENKGLVSRNWKAAERPYHHRPKRTDISRVEELSYDLKNQRNHDARSKNRHA